MVGDVLQNRAGGQRRRSDHDHPRSGYGVVEAPRGHIDGTKLSGGCERRRGVIIAGNLDIRELRGLKAEANRSTDETGADNRYALHVNLRPPLRPIRLCSRAGFYATSSAHLRRTISGLSERSWCPAIRSQIRWEQPASPASCALREG